MTPWTYPGILVATFLGENFLYATWLDLGWNNTFCIKMGTFHQNWQWCPRVGDLCSIPFDASRRSLHSLKGSFSPSRKNSDARVGNPKKSPKSPVPKNVQKILWRENVFSPPPMTPWTYPGILVATFLGENFLYATWLDLGWNNTFCIKMGTFHQNWQWCPRVGDLCSIPFDASRRSLHSLKGSFSPPRKNSDARVEKPTKKAENDFGAPWRPNLSTRIFVYLFRNYPISSFVRRRRSRSQILNRIPAKIRPFLVPSKNSDVRQTGSRNRSSSSFEWLVPRKVSYRPWRYWLLSSSGSGDILGKPFFGYEGAA